MRLSMHLQLLQIRIYYLFATIRTLFVARTGADY